MKISQTAAKFEKFDALALNGISSEQFVSKASPNGYTIYIDHWEAKCPTRDLKDAEKAKEPKKGEEVGVAAPTSLTKNPYVKINKEQPSAKFIQLTSKSKSKSMSTTKLRNKLTSKQMPY